MRLVVFGLLVALATMALAGVAAARVWDVTADFSIDNGNPNGAWSYGWAPVDFSAFNQYTNHGYIFGANDCPAWYGWNWDKAPLVWKNTSTPRYGVPTGWISLHPGPGTEPSIVRWTAPAEVSGPATVAGGLLVGHGGYKTVAVRKNNSEIWRAFVGGTFDLVTAVSPGDTIDFTVYGGYSDGNTPLAATISVVPEPSSLIALAGGLVSLLGIRRRSRE